MPYEVIQEEGQVLYIPEGWLHASITLSNISIAVSQNSIIFKPHSNLYYMAEAVKKGNKGQYEDAVQQLRWALKVQENETYTRTPSSESYLWTRPYINMNEISHVLLPFV